LGGGLDLSIERQVGELKVRAAEDDIHNYQEAMEQETDPEVKAQYQAAVEQKEAELNIVRLELAETWVRAQPNDGELRFKLGEALYKAGQWKRATEELQQAVNTQPSIRFPALNLLGLTFMKRNMIDFAISKFLEAKNDLPDMKDDMKKEVTYNLCLAYEASNQPVKALEQWKEIYNVQTSYRDVAARVEASYDNGA
jgi:tetratricopeptide (TPR) repeat protein